MVHELKTLIPGDPVKSCPFGRTHQGMCHVREGVQKAYVPASFPTLPGRGIKIPCCPEYIGGIPYCQPPNIGLSCKWVTGPGGLGYDRCDNYQSYHDVAVNGELLHDPNYPKVGYALDGYLQNALPIQSKTFFQKNKTKEISQCIVI